VTISVSMRNPSIVVVFVLTVSIDTSSHQVTDGLQATKLVARAPVHAVARRPSGSRLLSVTMGMVPSSRRIEHPQVMRTLLMGMTKPSGIAFILTGSFPSCRSKI